MSQQLLTPVRLGALELKNRVVMAPLSRCRTDNPSYVPTAMTARYYAQRASAGLIISEGTIVSPQARGYPFTPGIWSAEQVAGWRLATVAVHERGGLIVCQLWHCGRLSLPEFHDGRPPVAPSAVNPDWKMFSTSGHPETVTPHALARDEIKATVANFRRGAANAMAAGLCGFYTEGEYLAIRRSSALELIFFNKITTFISTIKNPYNQIGTVKIKLGYF